MSRLHTVVRGVAATADLLRNTAGVVVLIYHRVGATTPTEVDLPTALFDEQMALLAEQCRPVSLDAAADELEREVSPPGQPAVVVTFDDGTVDFVEHTLPVLARHGVPATLYVATEFIDEGRSFPNNGAPLTWAGVREAAASPLVSIGSHTHRHALLDRVSVADAAADLDRSIDLIGAEVGHAPAHFAYPKALLAAPPVEAEVRSRFRTASIARTRPNRHGDTDLHRLTRSPVQVSDGMRWFERKVSGGMGVENDLRDVMNRWRYRGASE